MEKLGLQDKIICNLVDKMFSVISVKEHWYEYNTLVKWLKSDVLKRLQDRDETLVCQSKIYLYNDFKAECKDLISHAEYQMHGKALSWVGYLFMYWIYLKNISGKDILNNYDIKEILTQYDVLHTMSVKVAINYIESNLFIGK